jgi:hypothetical protein
MRPLSQYVKPFLENTGVVAAMGGEVQLTFAS